MGLVLCDEDIDVPDRVGVVQVREWNGLEGGDAGDGFDDLPYHLSVGQALGGNPLREDLGEMEDSLPFSIETAVETTICSGVRCSLKSSPEFGAGSCVCEGVPSFVLEEPSPGESWLRGLRLILVGVLVPAFGRGSLSTPPPSPGSSPPPPPAPGASPPRPPAAHPGPRAS